MLNMCSYSARHMVTRFCRLREEAQGQRRLVSFGGGIALSAGSSQGSNAGIGVRGGGSQADACEISSDESDSNVSSSEDGEDDGDGGKRDREGHSTRHGKRREKPSRSSLEAFERIISGEDFCLESPSVLPANNGSVARGAGAGGGGISCGGGGKGTGGGASGDKGVDDDSDDCCEIMFTRVSRPGRTSASISSSSAPLQAKERPRTGSFAAGREAGRAGMNARKGSYPGGGVLSDSSEGDHRGTDSESD